MTRMNNVDLHLTWKATLSTWNDLKFDLENRLREISFSVARDRVFKKISRKSPQDRDSRIPHVRHDRVSRRISRARSCCTPIYHKKCLSALEKQYQACFDTCKKSALLRPQRWQSSLRTASCPLFCFWCEMWNAFCVWCHDLWDLTRFEVSLSLHCTAWFCVTDQCATWCAIAKVLETCDNSGLYFKTRWNWGTLFLVISKAKSGSHPRECVCWLSIDKSWVISLDLKAHCTCHHLSAKCVRCACSSVKTDFAS